MAWEFSNDKPIFQQLVERITMEIISGKYKSGDKLEAVRELALTAGVNPNTMQRAFAEIENEGLILTRRGDGRYVTDNIDTIKSIRQKYVDRSVNEFITSLKNLGLENNEILNCVKLSINDYKGG